MKLSKSAEIHNRELRGIGEHEAQTNSRVETAASKRVDGRQISVEIGPMGGILYFFSEGTLRCGLCAVKQRGA